MTGRGVAIQGALAALGLCVAYLTWQREPELTSGEVFVLDINRNDLQKVRYEDKEIKHWIELTQDKDDRGAFVLIRTAGSDASNVALPSGHPVVPLKVPERLVRGNDAATRQWERFAPLRASRALGVLDSAKAKELGLDATKKQIEITFRGGSKRTFAVVPAPPGGSNPYLRDTQDGRVYVVDRAILSELEAASSNLIERKLHGFFLEDSDRLVLSGGGKQRELVAARVEGGLPGITLALADRPTEPDHTARNWHDRIWALFPSEVLGKDEVPDTGPVVVDLRIDYAARGRKLGWIELGRSAPPATTTTQPSPTVVHARSEHTQGWMKLPADAAALLTEGLSLLSPPAPKPATPAAPASPAAAAPVPPAAPAK